MLIIKVIKLELIGYSFLGHVEAKLTGGFSDRNVRTIWMIKIPFENASS
jgi:hypothetical protein